MALALLLNQRQAKNSKPGKGENFGCKFKANFILETSSVKPFGKLSGQLVIESPAPITHYGIRVQFEAACALKFETKFDNRVRYHGKCGNLLGGCNAKDIVDGYLESPVLLDLEPVIKADASESRPYELKAGINTYGFTLAIPGEVLPAPFKSSYGTLVYKLVAYMRSENGVIVQVGEKVLRYGGYYNLSNNVEAAKSACIERSVKRSMFTTKKLVVVTLNLESCGYLPEDILRFLMRVQNQKCLPFKMEVQLLQKAIYTVNGTKKTTVAIVGSAEKEVNEPEPETMWEGSFKVHKKVSPTYVGRNSMYVVTHVVQFKVKLDDYNAMKSEQTVHIGTTREPVESLIASLSNMSVSENGTNERRNSISSIQSNSSVAIAYTTVSKPPLYAQLSTRMSSVDTLPLEYEDLDTENDVNNPIPESPDDENENQTEAELVTVSTPEEQINDND